MELSISKTRQFTRNGVVFSAYVVLVVTPHELKVIEKYRLDSRIVWPAGRIAVTDLLIGVDLDNADVLAMQRNLEEIGQGVKELAAYIKAADHFYGQARDEIR